MAGSASTARANAFRASSKRRSSISTRPTPFQATALPVCFAERGLVLLERGPELMPLQVQEAQVEPRGEQRAVPVERAAERGDGRLAGLARAHHPQVVPGKPVAGVRGHGALVRLDRFRHPAGLVQADPPLVPLLWRVGELADQGIVQLDRRRQLAA